MSGAFSLHRMQVEHKAWVEHNFPNQPGWHPLLGVAEETGELAHAHLKMEQGIRGTDEEHIAAAKDAVGDIVIYLVSYCNAMGFDFETLVNETWQHVKSRDWQRDREKGGTA